MNKDLKSCPFLYKFDKVNLTIPQLQFIILAITFYRNTQKITKTFSEKLEVNLALNSNMEHTFINS